VTIVLSSSAARPQYAQDVLTVLAAPQGLHVQFRYDKKYVAADLREQIAQNKVGGKAAVVAFVGDVATTDAYAIPIRLVTITDVIDFADAYVVRFVVGRYVNVSDWPLEQDAIIARGQTIMQDAYTTYGEHVAAMGKQGRLPITPADSEVTSWSAVAQRLATLEDFAECYLARVSVTNADKEALAIDDDGSIGVRYRRSVIISCWYYRASAPSQEHTVRVIADDKVMEFSSDAQRLILTRYDEVDFWLYAKPLSQNYRRTVTVEIAGANPLKNDVPTRVSIPLNACRPVLPRVGQWLCSAAGAGLVATPAMLGAGAQLEHKLIFAGIGAAIVASVTVFSDLFSGTRS
jgi:hypothetical protein